MYAHRFFVCDNYALFLELIWVVYVKNPFPYFFLTASTTSLPVNPLLSDGPGNPDDDGGACGENHASKDEKVGLFQTYIFIMVYPITAIIYVVLIGLICMNEWIMLLLHVVWIILDLNSQIS